MRNFIYSKTTAVVFSLCAVTAVTAGTPKLSVVAYWPKGAIGADAPLTPGPRWGFLRHNRKLEWHNFQSNVIGYNHDSL